MEAKGIQIRRRPRSSVILVPRAGPNGTGRRDIHVTDVMRRLVSGKGFRFEDRGETEMRGFEEPLRLFEMRWNN